MKASLKLLAAALVAGSMSATAPAAAQVSVTLFAGYGGTSGIDNATTNGSADVDSAAAFGVAVGWPMDASREFEVLYRQQSTTLAPGGGAAPFDLTVRYLHIGGSLFVDGSANRGLYVVGGVGVTQFSPSTSGFGNEVKPSANLGLGYRIPLGERVALKAEARGYATLVNSSGGFLCSGGCVVVLKADTITQYEATIGLSASF
jgi:hypothetical protein